MEFCEIRLPRYCGRFSTPFRWYYYTYTIYLLPWNIAVFPIYYAVSNTNDRNYYKHYNPPKLAELCDRCGLSIVSFVLWAHERVDGRRPNTVGMGKRWPVEAINFWCWSGSGSSGSVFIARQHTDVRYWYSNSVCPSARSSVRPSVTFRYCLKTA